MKTVGISFAIMFLAAGLFLSTARPMLAAARKCECGGYGPIEDGRCMNTNPHHCCCYQADDKAVLER